MTGLVTSVIKRENKDEKGGKDLLAASNKSTTMKNQKCLLER